MTGWGRGELLLTILLHQPVARGCYAGGQPCCHPFPLYGRGKEEGRDRSRSGEGDILSPGRLAVNCDTLVLSKASKSSVH
jgi:hypothetical protein